MPTKSQSYAAASLKDLETITRLDQLYVQARLKKRRYYDDWRRNYLLLNCKMWTDWRSSNWMPSPQDSEIYPIVASLIAWMTDQMVCFSCSASADPHTLYAQWLSKLSNDLENVLQSNWTNYAMDCQEALMLWDAALFGSGILKTIWDAGACDGLGDAMIRRIDPWQFYPDPNATCMEDSQYFIEEMRLSFDEVQRRYPLAYDKLMAAEAFFEQDAGSDLDFRPNIYDDTTFPKANAGLLPTASSGNYGAAQNTFGLPGQGRRNKGSILSNGVIVREYWLRENRVESIEDSPQKEKPNPEFDYPDTIVYDEWRVVVVASGVILLDEYASDLWGSGRHPYSRFSFDDIGEFWGMALVSHLAPPQIAINRLLASVQHNAELIGNPIFLESDDSGISRTAIINRPGQRLRTKGGPNASATPPGWMPPPQMPPFIQELIQFWINRMENISGLGGSSKGNLPPARTPSASVVSSQESGFVRIRQGMRNLESCLREAGNLVCELITENYTTPRVIAIVGPDGEQTSLSLAARHFYDPNDDGALPWKFSILIDAGANNPTSRQSRIAEADTLFALHAIDQQALLEAHAYPHAMEILQRMKEDMLSQLLAKQNSGPGNRVRSGRNT